MKSFSESFVKECKRRLLDAKIEALNRARNSRMEFQLLDRSGGDEADLTMNLLAENGYLTSQQRLKSQLLEIELALARIEAGSYGVCEETEQYIEPERLKAIPWTRLSIEGAEIREDIRRKFVR